jgi:RNA polymerase sigma factor (sigma-70 family)
MFCKNCGKEVNENAKFCGHCGAEIEIPAKIDVQPTEKIDSISSLVENAKNGDSDAFSKLFEVTQQKAYYTALKITKNEQDAQDMLQDAYVKAFTSLDTLKDNSKFVSWFNCIVANSCRNYVVKKKPNLFSQYENDDTDFDFEESLENEDNTMVPHEVADNKETKRLVMNCIENLPDDQKLCVIMFYYDEMSIKDIASSLSIPEATVKSRLFHARKKLKGDFELLEKQGTKLYGAGITPLIRSALGDSASVLSKSNVAKLLKAIIKAVLGKGAIAGATTATTATATVVGASVVKKAVIGVVVASVVAGGTGTGVAVAKKVEGKKENSTAVVATTETLTNTAEKTTKATTVKLDAEHQKNVDEAMKYHIDDYNENFASQMSFEYGDYVFYVDRDTQSINRRDTKTNTSEKLFDADTIDILIKDDKLYYTDQNTLGVYQVDLKDENLASKKINTKPLYLPVSGDNFFPMINNIVYRNGNILYVAQENSEYNIGDEIETIYAYNIKTDKTTKVKGIEFPDLINGNLTLNGYLVYLQNTGKSKINYVFYDYDGNIISKSEDWFDIEDGLVFETDEYIMVKESENDGINAKYTITNKLTGNVHTLNSYSGSVYNESPSIVGDTLYYWQYEKDEEGDVKSLVLKNMSLKD